MEKSTFKLAILVALLVLASYAEMRAEARNVVILRCHKDEECKFSCSQCQCVCKNTWCKCPDDPPANLS
ncbi:hypothetical protein RGQ29_017669 [Quercus rubra]|uniref:Uncharacterized protein n=1 Tax=Quercus rubra TaxID=3512 RepID=A0AAN7J179_QUERU|nr:hypothetical protein RGQ29_017669 [Quercus rubra]